MAKLKNILTFSLGGLAGFVAIIIYFAVYLFLTGLMIVLAISFYHGVMNHFHHKDITSTVVTPSNQATLYVATKDKFQINFPGIPTITNNPPKVQADGTTQSSTGYELKDEAKTTDYLIVIVHYSNLKAESLADTDVQTALQGEMNNFSQGFNSTILNSRYTTLAGKKAIEATLMSNDKKTVNSNFEIFMSGDAVYIVFSFGIDQNTFDNYANSFKFVQ